jgi:hypothetical protein
MFRSCLPLFVVVALSAGCSSRTLEEFLGTGHGTTLVPPGSAGETQPAPAQPPSRSSFGPADGATALRVDMIGRKILSANSQAGLQPLFLTLGSPRPEIFHRGVTELHITDGLVRQCASEGQLAAVLCHELGKMVAEREALAGPLGRTVDRRLPPEVPIGNAGQFGGIDQVRLAEVDKYNRDRHHSAQPLPPPDPGKLARLYLKSAGYPESDLDAVAPLLKTAQGNFVLEKQIKASGPAPAWVPGR